MIEVNARAGHGKPTTYKQFRNAASAEAFLRTWMPQNISAIDYNAEIARCRETGCRYITPFRNAPTAFISWTEL